MEQQTTEPTVESSVTWERLEACLRGRMRQWIQELLEAEVDELLGRRKSARRKAVDGAPGSRSGHGKPRRLTLCHGTVTVRRPRVRGVQPRVESRLLPLFARRTPAVSALLPELYLHGLAQGDFDLALRGLLGEDAPRSATTVGRLKEQWHAEQAPWARRPLADLEVVSLWVGGRGVREGRPGEGAGGSPGGAGCRARRAQGARHADPGASGVDGGLVGSPPRPEGVGQGLAEAGDRGRTSGDLGRAADRLPGGPGTAVLEPSDRQRWTRCPQPGRLRPGSSSRRSPTRRRRRKRSG